MISVLGSKTDIRGLTDGRWRHIGRIICLDDVAIRFFVEICAAEKETKLMAYKNFVLCIDKEVDIIISNFAASMT